MKMNKIRIITAILVMIAMCVVMLSACADTSQPGGTDQTPSQGSGGGGGGGGSGGGGGDAQPAGDPVVITMRNYVNPFGAIDNFVDTPLGQLILEKFNIKFEFFPSTLDGYEELVMDIASGMLADITVTWISPTSPHISELLFRAANEGVYTDFSNIIGNYPILNDAMKRENLPLFTQSVVLNPDFGNSMYLLPTGHPVAGPATNGWGIYIREDIANELNLSMPSPQIRTTDDVLNLLRDIQSRGFKDTNGNDIWAIGNIGQWPHIMAAMNRPFDFGGAARFGLDGNTVKGFIESDFAWNQVLWMRQLLDEGLLDPESLTHIYEIGVEKMAQARYAVTMLYSWMTTTGEAFSRAISESDHPEMRYRPLGNMVNNKGETTQVINMGMFPHQVFAIKSGANIEAIFDLFNWASSFEGKPHTMLGIEGTHWFWGDDGFAHLTQEAYDEYHTDSLAFNERYGHIGFIQNIAGTDNPKTSPFAGEEHHISPFQSMGPLRAEILHNERSVMPDFTVINQMAINHLIPEFPGVTQLDPVLQQMPDMLIQMYLASSEAEARNIYDGYLNTLRANGYDDLLAFFQAAHDADPTKYAFYLTEVQ